MVQIQKDGRLFYVTKEIKYKQKEKKTKFTNYSLQLLNVTDFEATLLTGRFTVLSIKITLTKYTLILILP